MKWTFFYDADGRDTLSKVELVGSWDQKGSYDSQWSAPAVLMKEVERGLWRAVVELRYDEGERFEYGFLVSGPGGERQWGVLEERNPSLIPSLSREAKVTYHTSLWQQMGLRQTREGDFLCRVWAPGAKEVSLLLKERRETPLPLAKDHDFKGCWSARFNKKELPKKREFSYLFAILGGDEKLRYRADPYCWKREGPWTGWQDYYRCDETLEQAHCYWSEDTGKKASLFWWIATKNSEAKRVRCGLSGRELPLIERWGQRGIELKETGDIWEFLDAKGRVVERIKAGDHRPIWAGWSVFSQEPKRCGLDRTKRELFQIYEIHLPSFKKELDHRLSELGQELERIAEQGFNVVELMPIGVQEGYQDWGYLGCQGLALSPRIAPDGFKELAKVCQQASRNQLEIWVDVVPNHSAGLCNDLWDWDGKNSWFCWSQECEPLEERCLWPGSVEGSLEKGYVHTSWGPMLALDQRMPAQLMIDSFLALIEFAGVRGLRFDFTRPIHEASQGGGVGWSWLRRFHRFLKLFYPQVECSAEEFPAFKEMVGEVQEGGAGFSHMWHTELQHRFFYHAQQDSLLVTLLSGKRPKAKQMKLFLSPFLSPQGFPHARTLIQILTSHDEVGNGKRWAQILRENPHPQAKEILCSVLALALMAPGHTLFFQGSESLASEPFLWGRWLSWKREEGEMKDFACHLQALLKALFAIRKEYPQSFLELQTEIVEVDWKACKIVMARGELCWDYRWGKGGTNRVLGSLLLSSQDPTAKGGGCFSKRKLSPFELRLYRRSSL